MSNLSWKQDAVPPQNKIPVSNTKLRDFGLKPGEIRLVNTIEELRESPPGIIIAEAINTVAFVQNWFKRQQLIKKKKYVMGLGVYQQLHRSNPPNKKPKKVLRPSAVKFKNIYKPYVGQDLNDKTILVFRTGVIGDLLFIQPNLNYLKRQYDCKIKFACGPQYQAMVENWDCIDELLDLPFELKHLQQSDYHVLFEGVIERCKEAHTVNAYNLFSRWLGLDLPDRLLIPQQEPKLELIELCMSILKEWGIAEESFILMQLRASSPIRTPRPEFWVETINQLTEKGHNIVLTDNPRQSENIDNFISSLKQPNKVFNFCKHSKTLAHSIAITKFASMTLTTDSAFVHIAASLNVPCFGIYGPFPGYIRLKTYPKAAWVDAQKECAPCYIHSNEPCPKAGTDGFSPCYDNIDIPKMIERIEVLLNS